jgi:hypothetical protein
MNTQMVFKKKAFAEAYPTFVGDVIGTAEDKTNYVLTRANDCRDWYSPIFANESKYLPVSDTVVTLDKSAPRDMSSLELNSDGSFKDVSELTTPPQKQMFTDLEKGLICVGVAFVIIKLLS